MAEQRNGQNVGKLIEVKGVVIDALFPDELPEIYHAVRLSVDDREIIAEVQQHLGDDRVRAVAMDSTDGLSRGLDVVDLGGPITVPVGEQTLGRVWNVIGEPVDNKPAPADGVERWPIHRDPPALQRPLREDRDLRDRDQGHRPDRTVRPRRQGRPLRRRRRRQDGAHPGADPQRREGARRRVGLRGRRRAHARGQRPSARDGGVEGDRQGRARLRADERAAGRAPASRALGPDDGRVLPRRGPGRAALHRQHLPLRPGGLRGLGAARPHAERRRLPADAEHRDGAAPGADHLDAEGLGDVDPGDLRAGRRLHRPGAGERLRAPRLVGRARALDRRDGDLPGDGPARVVLARSPAGHRRRGALRGDDARPAGAPALQGPPGHHRDPRHGRAHRRGQADGDPRAEDPALPLAAELRRRAVHGDARRVRAARGHDQGLPGDPRGQARRAAGAGVLHGRHDRAGGREGRGGGGAGRGEPSEPAEEEAESAGRARARAESHRA